MMQGNDSFRLVVRRGPQPNQVYELNKDIVTLGRDITNDITINDPEVSRHHMRLTRGASGFTLEDLGSTNGTFVNGQRVTGARPLRNGDMVGLGETVTLGYEAAGMPAGPSAYAPPDAGMPQTMPGPSARPSAAPVAPASPAPNPYAPPSSQPPQQSPYGAGGYGGGAAAYSAPPVVPQAPPGTGYDYDPYEVREEEPRSNARWFLIGCVGLSLFCCCGTLVGAFAVDQLCLWDRIPVLYQIIQAFGRTMVCT